MLTAFLTMAAGACVASHGLEFACGLRDPEDLVAIPGKPWVIAGSFPRDGSPGGLYLIDTRTRQIKALGAGNAASPATGTWRKARGRCGPPDPQRFVVHGMALRAGKGDRHRLYVVNHGGRESIEMFDVDARGPAPAIRWRGCIVVPDGVEPNSVVGLSDGSLLFTTLYDPGEKDWPKRIAKLSTGAPSGGVFEWRKASGFRRIPVPPISGPNGIEISADEKSIFLTGWADGSLWRLDRSGKATAPSVKVAFLPDNLHRTADGMLLAAGQPETVATMFKCNMQPAKPLYCSDGWAAASLDPASMTLRQEWSGKAGGRFGDATSALMIGGRLWIGSLNGDRIAIADPAAPHRSQENR